MLASRNQVDELPVINMTPMVDVILCLLVFFMAATGCMIGTTASSSSTCRRSPRQHRQRPPRRPGCDRGPARRRLGRRIDVQPRPARQLAAQGEGRDTSTKVW